MPSFNDVVGWILHVPGEYELLWWVLGAVMWYGFITERKLKALQVQLEEFRVSQPVSILDGKGQPSGG